MDASDNLTRDWQDLDLTREDLNLITESLKNDKFRELLSEYANEVNDPKNRKIYEDEFTQLERQRGVDVTFLKPQPGYVLKTSANGERKCFLNISESDIVEKPSSRPSCEDGNRGLKWSIPYTLTPPRDDLDRNNVRCIVVDVVFHPDTLHLASKNAQFRDIVNNTAIDGVETHFKMKLDRKNLKFPKMTYKGNYHPSVIRKPAEKSAPPNPETEVEPEIYQKMMSNYDQTRERQSKLYAEKPQKPTPTTRYFTDQHSKTSEIEDYAKPKVLVKYQKDIDMLDFTLDKDKLGSAMPKTLLIIIDLPLLRSAEDATLDVQERLLTLKSERPAKYYLKLPLCYRVDADHGSAKFDLKSRKLSVSLPVIRSPVCPEDSGVDSDSGSPVHEAADNLELGSESVTVSSDEGNFTLITGSMDEEDVRICVEEEEPVSEKEVPFMNQDVKHNLPVFFCNVFENILAVTVNVKNVENGSIKHRILKCDSGFHLVCKSVGAGFFPSYYSLCFKIRPDVILPESLSVEPWDNNVVLTVSLKDTENLIEYQAGLDENSLETKYFSSVESVKKKLDNLKLEPVGESIKDVEVEREEDGLVININSRQTDSEDEDQRTQDEDELVLLQQERKRTLIKSRSISESSSDELPSAARYKSILKSRREFSRSVSESSIDDGLVAAPSVQYSYDSAQEINSESECSNLKKTVRFNEIVSRQLFRSNSSILGRRKKNQRKMRNKKRAHERRMSESENSETDERDKFKIQAKTQEGI